MYFALPASWESYAMGWGATVTIGHGMREKKVSHGQAWWYSKNDL